MSDALPVRMVSVDSLADIRRDMVSKNSRANGSGFVPELSKLSVRLEGAVGLPKLSARTGFNQRPLVEGFSERFYNGFLSDGDALPAFSGGLVSLYRVLKKTSLEDSLHELGGSQQIKTSLVEALLVLRRYLGDRRVEKLTFYIPNKFGVVCEVSAARYQVGWFLMSRETSLRVGNGNPPGGRFALALLKIENGLEKDQLIICSYMPLEKTTLFR